MNNLKFLLLALIIPFAMFSCDNDDVNGESVIEPDDPTAYLTLDLKVDEFKYKSENTVTGEVSVDIDCKMDNMTEVILVVHSAGSGDFVGMKTITDIASMKDKEGNYLISDYVLPFGSYYMTVIAAMVDEPLTQKDLLPMTLSYTEAACRIPNTIVCYKTFKLELEADNEFQDVKHFRETVNLDLITKGFFSYEIADWDKVPQGAKIEAVARLRQLPAAFFIHTGRTLSEEEHEQLGLSLYGEVVTIKEVPSKQNVVTYLVLSNEHLNDLPAHRGIFSFTYKEDGELKKESKDIALKKHGDENWSGYTYIEDLYSNDTPEIIEDNKTGE